jgi:hypothetical protein
LPAEIPRPRLKVFEVIECGGPGGTGSQVAAIVNNLDPKRFKVGLVFSVRQGGPEEYRSQCPGATKTFYVSELVREIAPLKDFSALRRLYRIFRDEKPDVVHSHSSKAGVLGRWAAMFAGVPLVFYSPRGYGFLQKDSGLFSRALYWLIEASVSWIGTIVAVSENEAVLARRLCWGKSVAKVCDAYLGEALPSRPSKTGSEILIGACGRLTAARNPAAFVRLAADMIERKPKTRFVWIGGGELESEIRLQIKDSGLAKRFELTGWLSAEEARRRISGLDVFVHYSAWDSIPNSVLEAMALGVPVLASDIPANRELLAREAGVLAKTENELLLSALVMADEKILRGMLGAEGKKRVAEFFGLKRMISELEALYGGQVLT